MRGRRTRGEASEASLHDETPARSSCGGFSAATWRRRWPRVSAGLLLPAQHLHPSHWSRPRQGILRDSRGDSLSRRGGLSGARAISQDRLRGGFGILEPFYLVYCPDQPL